MAKAKPKDVTALGFSGQQFGSPGRWDVPNGYIAGIINVMAQEVADRVGQTAYDAATGLALERMRQAEIWLTAAELWRRMEQFERADLNMARSDGGAETISSRLLKNAEAAEERAEQWLARITGGGGLAVGYVQTGPYSEETA